MSSIGYGYDADNNITSKNTTGVAGAGNNAYAYDQLGRLTSWTKGATTTAYGWDGNSNRIKAGTALASYDERNRLLNDGTSTYTYSPRGALLTQTTGATTEAFSFDAFDRMITRSDRDFAYDALDRPVQAGTARMRYDGFSDEVVSDGTQFFGRAASDGLLSVGYDTTKRLVLADRHGDVFAGFDPADTTLSAGLPDSRTYDPFGNSTSATGLKYRVGYQGDWTDPRSGDINQGARWYNPGTGTFNTRDTVSYNAGTTSAALNLYAYAGGNPLTYNDPDGHKYWEPGGHDSKCYHDPKKPINGPEIYPQYGITCDPPKDEPDCKKTNSCNPCKPGTRICEKGGDDGDGGDGDGDCKKRCDGDGDGSDGGGDGDCKTTKCGKKPPPKCDAQCQLNKKTKKTRDDLEQDAKTIAQPPPGDPVCANGNPALCPGDPTQPATVVGPGGDLTGETVAWSTQQYQNALNQYGSVISNVATTGNYNWFNGIEICESAECGGGEPGPPQVGGITGRGSVETGRGGRSGRAEGRTGELAESCGCTPQLSNGDVRSDVSEWFGSPGIKPGTSGGETAGRRFPTSVREKILEENPDTCVYCRMKTSKPQADHSVPRSRDGDATVENGQTTCPHCNASKGNRDFPVTPPGGYSGPWPPQWWPN